MAVNLHGKCSCGMSQIRLNILDIIATLQGVDREAMAKIMEAVIRKIRPLQNFLVVLHNSSADQIFSVFRGKHQIMRIVPF